MEFFRDSIWQSIGAIFSLAALIVSIYLFWLQRRIKSIKYEVISETALLPQEKILPSKMQLLFDGKPITNPHILVLQILNDGNVPIASSDFENNLTLAFDETTKIISAEVINTHPNTLNPEYVIEGNKASIMPLLLNSGDAITFKFVLENYNSTMNFNARILGVSGIKPKSLNINKLIIILMGGGFLLSLGFTGLITKALEKEMKPQSEIRLISFVPDFLIWGLILIGLFMAGSAISATYKIIGRREQIEGSEQKKNG